MTDTFMADSAVQERYGFAAGSSFDEQFSKVSIESLLFYVVAFGIWVLEKLFDTHKEEVATMLADLTPHTTRWYRNRVLAFVPGWAENNEPPVKYCSVDDRGSRLKIKIAAGSAGARTTVQAASSDTPPETAVASLESFLANEKDAGIKIEVVNLPGDDLKAALKVWYDPIQLVPSSTTVKDALKAYISNLDFDGLMTRNGIVDALREVPGVEMVRINQLLTKAHSASLWEEYGDQRRAVSGYWTLADADITIEYERYTKDNIVQ